MKRRLWRALLIALSLSFCVPVHAVAQDVTLRSADGSVEIIGALVAFDGEFYKIATPFGELTVNALGVRCSGLACPDTGQYAADLKISGTQAISPALIPALVENFAFTSGQVIVREPPDENSVTYSISDRVGVPVARVEIIPSSSNLGFSELIQGKSQLALTYRYAQGHQTLVALTGIAAAGPVQIESQLLALDGLFVIVAQDNPVRSISLENAARVFAGEIDNWAALGGADAPIALYRQRRNTDLGILLQNHVMIPNGGRVLAPAARLDGPAETSRMVARDALGIGITNFPNIGNARALAIVGPCGHSIAATEFNVKSEDYPLTQHILLHTTGEHLPVFTRNFKAYLKGDLAQRAFTRLGFVGQNVTRQSWAQQGDRVINSIRTGSQDVTLESLRGMAISLFGAERLSTTFRFMESSTEMDRRSLINIDQVARMIEFGDFDGRELIVAGFSDAEGGPDGNRRISRQRAEQVAARLKKNATIADLSKIKFTVTGFGEISPLACNGDAVGRRINRRVELWIR